MNEEKARKILESGEFLDGNSTWTWSARFMCCYDPGCCDNSFENIDESLEHLKNYIGNDWTLVEELK